MGGVSFSRLLGSTRTVHEEAQQPQRHDGAQDDQRPYNRRHSNHRSLITQPAQGSVCLKEPGLNQIPRGYRDECGEIVHVTERQRGCDARDKEERYRHVPKAGSHPSLTIIRQLRAA